ncbi:unnamed protein product [Staurois parvus]|uniref:Uncharacterized protein n=1 Tax=Staurois parvus TaxID=386267 RepID=A0ABN9CL64_9NEOB|nr:unnamed protein product [Staurois parvus]
MLHKKKNIAYTPNKDQRHSGTSRDFEWLYQDDVCRIVFTSSRRRCPPPPLPSTAFSGSPVPLEEPENAAGVSAN